MNVTLKASNFGVLGDCGRYPLYITTFKRVIKFLIKILRMLSHRYVKNAMICWYAMISLDIKTGPPKLKIFYLEMALVLSGKPSLFKMK